MRDILFKAKRIDNGEWVEGSFIDSGNHYQVFIYPHDDSASTMSCKTLVYHGMVAVDSKTICQFTGLLDKKGNKIWENDVVKDTDIHLLGSVEYDEEHGMYVINEVNDGYQNFQEFWSCTEVIGNIFDNPELLKGGSVE